MTVAAPPLQREVALAKANYIRMGRAALKRDLYAGKLTLTELLDDLPHCMETAPVPEILKSLPHLGPTKAAKIMGSLHFSEVRKLGSLTERERRLLLEAVWEYAPSSLGNV